ncbi:hypothetical protein K435DRAFT_706849, partial [Dendrothele bispora CBS 962.96]
SSSPFDIKSDMLGGDSRTCLDEGGAQEVRDIMSKERVNFDQTRLICQSRILAVNGIIPSGTSFCPFYLYS